jgi:hypothetical protein
VCSPTLPLTNTARGGAQSRTLPLTDPGEVDLGQDGLGVLPPALADFAVAADVPCQDCPQSLPSGCIFQCYQAFGCAL